MLQDVISSIDSVVGPPLVVALLFTGLFMTLRLKLIQIRRLGHGFAVTSGRYDDPSEPGDVSHFQALTTALSATVGIGNIAGVAIAIHWGGPGALFWMWITAAFGMALKYSEVTLAQKYREVEAPDPDGANAWKGSVSGGPMYYIEKGLGAKWKGMAIFFAGALMITSFFTGNAIQANTIADNLFDEFRFPVWASGLVTSTLVALVILGGIRRIGRVTSILAPLMALVYVAGALLILVLNLDHIPGAFATIFSEAFNPTAGVAGTGVGAVMATMMWGVRRGLFSNEAGQGSAPIAHAAAQTDEPVSEGVVALLEPFIDTILICSMTGLVIISTGVWSERVPTGLVLVGGDSSYVEVAADGSMLPVAEIPARIEIRGGDQTANGVRLAWHEVAVERLFVDAQQKTPFDGTLLPAEGKATASDGTQYTMLYAQAVESGAPLTKLAFQQGLSALGGWGGYIVLFSVLLFGISTAISWSYYGDRCANYLFGARAILPYKVAFVTMHFIGAVTSLNTIWSIGDIALSFCTFPNLIAVLMLSGVVAKLTDDYFKREPWVENAEAHKLWRQQRKGK